MYDSRGQPSWDRTNVHGNRFHKSDVRETHRFIHRNDDFFFVVKLSYTLDHAVNIVQIIICLNYLATNILVDR